MREATLARHPDLRPAVARLAGKITDREMRRMNEMVVGERRDITDVAREFLRSNGID